MSLVHLTLIISQRSMCTVQTKRKLRNIELNQKDKSQDTLHSTSSFKASEDSLSTILGTTSALVTPPTTSMSAKASQFGVGIPPPGLRPCEPPSERILAR